MPLYFARARRLAEGGDLRGALEGLGCLPRLRPAASAAEIYELGRRTARQMAARKRR
jgi:hypothetical protein